MSNVLSKIISTSVENGFLYVKALVLGTNVSKANVSLPFGVDSRPQPNMKGFIASSQIRGDNAFLGVLNQTITTNEGEIKIYSLKSDNSLSFYIYCKNDGICEISGVGKTDNLVSYADLKSGFDQLRNDLNNFVNIFNTHVHAGVTTGGGSSGATATPGSSSSADISNCKIDNISTK